MLLEDERVDQIDTSRSEGHAKPPNWTSDEHI